MKLTTRSIATAQAIADRKTFSTSGALAGSATNGLGLFASGRLGGPDLDRFALDRAFIDYVVTSYSTPIAWHTASGWYQVKAKFSITTTKHQGNLYLTSVQ